MTRDQVIKELSRNSHVIHDLETDIYFKRGDHEKLRKRLAEANQLQVSLRKMRDKIAIHNRQKRRSA